MVHDWELQKVKDWTTAQIKNCIWSAVDRGQPVPGCVSVAALRAEVSAQRRRAGRISQNID